MENTQKLTIYAKEIKLGDGKSFVAFTTLVKNKWFKVKFTRECLTTPKEKGMYHMTINMDDVSIVVRKVNNTTTSVQLEYTEYTKNNATPSFFGIKAADDGWKITVLEKAYSTLENVLGQMFNK